MSRRNRTPAPTTPALVSNATPADAAPAPIVVPSDTPTTPAVPSTEPLPADQATAADRPVGADGLVGVTGDDAARIAGDRPSIVPETPIATDLVTPTTHAVASDVVMERVDSTVPLPADQVTPVAPVPVPSLADALANATPADRAALRDFLGYGGGGVDVSSLEERLFPVAYEVDHDGTLYRPGGKWIALTFDQHAHFLSTTAVQLPWLDGVVDDA